MELVLGCPIKRDSNATTYGFIIVQHSAEIGKMTKFWAKNGGANMATETHGFHNLANGAPLLIDISNNCCPIYGEQGYCL